MDWGLWRCSKPERYGLREVITYPKWYYYYAIVNDLILRLLWLFGVFLSPIDFPILVSIGWGTLMGVLELYRRWCWSLLRIENEQVSNLEKYRNVLDIPEVTESQDETLGFDE